jgi:signal transduction histidine kinase
MRDSDVSGGGRRGIGAALGLLREHAVTGGDVVAVVVVAALSLWLLQSFDPPALVAVAGAVLAAAVSRRRPALALGLVWAAGIVQLFDSTAVFGLEAAAALVAYRTARLGRPAAVWAAGLSIPMGASLVIGFAVLHPHSLAGVAVLAEVLRVSGTGSVTVPVLVVSVLAAPWVLGLLIRFDARYRRARGERETAQAEAAAVRELAELRRRQTQLAREVHDVIGHSLAVIIAQADAAQLQASGDTGAVRTALAQIAAVGRDSLAEVRGVLTQTRGPMPAADRAELDLSTLIEGVRDAGTTVDDVIDGDAADLDTATAAAAYRVLQELLTNALKHGAPHGPIGVTRCWTPGGLTLRVTNDFAAEADPAPEGMGLPAVRSRVEAVGASFRTEIRRPPGRSPSFVATAYFPLLVTRSA